MSLPNFSPLLLNDDTTKTNDILVDPGSMWPINKKFANRFTIKVAVIAQEIQEQIDNYYNLWKIHSKEFSDLMVWIDGKYYPHLIEINIKLIKQHFPEVSTPYIKKEIKTLGRYYWNIKFYENPWRACVDFREWGKTADLPPLKPVNDFNELDKK